MIRLAGLGFKYRDYVFSDVNYEFDEGTLYVLRGSNGVGKTTLVKVMLGLLPPSRGEVERPKNMRMSYLPDTGGIYEELTITQNLRFRLALYGVRFCDAREEVDVWLTALGCREYADARVEALSMGTRKKCAIACSCIVPSDFLVLDEPFNALDDASRSAVGRLLPGLAQGGRTVICVSHSFDCPGAKLIELGNNGLRALS